MKTIGQPAWKQEAKVAIAASLNIAVDMVQDSTQFHGIGGDSLDMIEIAMNLEDTFGVQINHFDVSANMTVGEFLALVEGNAMTAG